MVFPLIRFALVVRPGAGDGFGLVRRTGIVWRCEEFIITRKRGVLEGIFANFKIGLREDGLVCALVV